MDSGQWTREEVTIGRLPGAFDAEGFEAVGFLFVEVVFEDEVNAAAARTAMEAQAQFGEIFGSARGDDLDIPFFSVANPAGEAQFTRLAVNEPAEADTLNATLNEKMKNHGVTIASVADGAAGRNRSGISVETG